MENLTKMPIDVVIFDLGKVIFDFDISKLSKEFSENSTKTYQEINNIFLNHWEIIAEYEKGRITSKKFYSLMKKELDLNVVYGKFCDIWNYIFTPDRNVIDFLRILSQKYTLSLLSNTNNLHFEFLNREYPDVFKLFKNFHLSYLMNTRKPEQEIYRKVIKFYDIEPHKIFFTDDIPVNVKEAKKTGISAFQFINLTKLKQDLLSTGILL